MSYLFLVHITIQLKQSKKKRKIFPSVLNFGYNMVEKHWKSKMLAIIGRYLPDLYGIYTDKTPAVAIFKTS